DVWPRATKVNISTSRSFRFTSFGRRLVPATPASSASTIIVERVEIDRVGDVVIVPRAITARSDGSNASFGHRFRFATSQLILILPAYGSLTRMRAGEVAQSVCRKRGLPANFGSLGECDPTKRAVL